MRISEIDLFTVHLPYAGGTYHLSGGRTYTGFTAQIVRVGTACGLSGWGESTAFGSTYIAAHPAGIAAAIGEMAPALIGTNPCHSDVIMDRMDQALVGHHSAKAALDIACWDLFGQKVGMPIYELLGGKRSAALPLISSIHAGTPEDMRHRVDLFRRRGYRGHSVKIGTLDADGGPMLDADRLRACVADRKPGEYFLVDANGGMTPDAVLRFLTLVEDVDFVLEAPCATWRETETVRRQSSRTMMLDELAVDEADIISLVTGNIADGFGLKMTKNGGFTHGRRQRDIAIAAGLGISVQDTVGSTMSFAAIAHMAHAVPPQNLRCALDVRDMVTVATGQFDAVMTADGMVAPDRPGLGVVPDMKVLGAPIAQCR